MMLTIYVPRPDSGLGIDRGSAVVGSPASEWSTTLPDLSGVVIDYEGNRYGASNMVTWADRLLHAAGRHVAHYPTVARQFLHTDKAKALREVGTYDPDTLGIVLDGVAAEELVSEWLDRAPLKDELKTSGFTLGL